MRVGCQSCGAELQLNPNLAGTTVSCPECGGSVTVPKRKPKPVAQETRTASTPKRKRKLRPSMWLYAAQLAVAVIGLSCLAGAFFGPGWRPPDWSYFAESPKWLMPAGIVFLILCWLVSIVPVLATLVSAVFVLCASAHAYVLSERIDASRTLALSVAMLALWCALQHRRTRQPSG